MKSFRLGAVGVVCALALLTPVASYGALVAGSTLYTEGGAVVGATFVNWECNQPGDTVCTSPPANKGDFTVLTSTGTFAQYNGTFGLITDINNVSQPLNTPFSLPNFMTFDLNGNESIELNFIPLGTDTPSLTCAGLSHCTPENPALVTPANPMGLSAFNLDQGSTGTTASFYVMGTIHDSSGASAPLTGTFSIPFNGDTPQQALAAFLASLSNVPPGLAVTYGGNFTFTIVPEPVSVGLVGAGLLALGLFRRRA